MKKSLKRAVAVSAVCAAGLAGTLTTTTGAIAKDESAATPRVLTDFGMKAIAYGTKVVIGGIDVKSLNDAKTIQACTRMTGLERVKDSGLSTGALLPIPNDLIAISPSKSVTTTYTEGTRTGSRAINRIVDISVGGRVLDPIDLEIPTLKIKGLTSVADSFFDEATGKFGTAESFSFDGLSLELPQDGVISDTLDVLLDNLGLSSDDLQDVIDVPLDILNETITQIITSGLGNVIEIPGLGTLGLGKSFTRVQDDFASSGATALLVDVDPSDKGNDSLTQLRLGSAQSYIGAPAESSVFRGAVMGLDFVAGELNNDISLLHLGGIGTESIPCQGTEDGALETKKLDGPYSIPLDIPGIGGLATLNGLEYGYQGKQLAGGRSKALSFSKLGDLRIDALNLELKGIETIVRLRGEAKDGKMTGRVRRDVQIKVADILHNGESLIAGKTLKPFETILDFVDDATGTEGIIQFGVDRTSKNQNYYGKAISAIRISLPGLGTKLDLGWVESSIFPK